VSVARRELRPASDRLAGRIEPGTDPRSKSENPKIQSASSLAFGLHQRCRSADAAAAAAYVRKGENSMARMQGIEPHEAGWMTRFIYWLAQRAVNKLTGQSRVPEPIKITAHHPRLLKAVGQMEAAQAAAASVPASLKSLAGIKTASLVGCPF
jgi:hypothetical protein